MSIEQRVSPLFKVREDLNSTGTARRNIKVLRTLGFFSVRRAIDIKVLTDLNGGLRLDGISEMPMETARTPLHLHPRIPIRLLN